MLKKIAATGILAFAVSGAVMASAGAASAEVDTSTHEGVVSGNQVSVPVTVCGNSVQVIAVLAENGAGCQGNAYADETDDDNGHGYHK